MKKNILRFCSRQGSRFYRIWHHFHFHFHFHTISKCILVLFDCVFCFRNCCCGVRYSPRHHRKKKEHALYTKAEIIYTLLKWQSNQKYSETTFPSTWSQRAFSKSKSGVWIYCAQLQTCCHLTFGKICWENYKSKKKNYMKNKIMRKSKQTILKKCDFELTTQTHQMVLQCGVHPLHVLFVCGAFFRFHFY